MNDILRKSEVNQEGMLLIPGTGNGEQGTGVWERVYSGNPLENSKWRTKQKERPQESREETI